MTLQAVVIARKEFFSGLRDFSFWVAFAASALAAVAAWAVLGRLSPVPAGERAARLVETLLLATPPLAAAAAGGAFARDRASGALETLLAAPVSDWQVVLGKFLAAFALVVAGTAALAGAAAAAAAPLGFPPPGDGEANLVAAGLAAVATAQAAWCASGLALSLACRRESAAAAATLALAAASALVASGSLSFLPPDCALSRLDLVQFALGVADTRPVFAFASASAFLLFAATRGLESRFWLPSSAG